MFEGDFNTFPHIRSSTLREKCPYSELFWSTLSRIRTEYGEILRIFLYSVRIRENADQNNSEHGHFLRSATVKTILGIFRTVLVSTNWPEPILENDIKNSHLLFSNQGVINKALLKERPSSFNIMVFVKVGILSENAYLFLLLIFHFILLPNSLCWLQILVIFFQFYIVFPYFFPVTMLSSIAFVVSSNATQPAKSNSLMFLKCPSVQVPRCSSAQVP